MRKIAIIEDDLGISRSLKLYLENSDFQVVLYHSGENAENFLLSENPDLVILDINLPGKDGRDICRDFRKQSQIPVIMLTARGMESDKILGLDMGADDYIAKPFSPRELLARIQSILRRSSLVQSEFKGESEQGILYFPGGKILTQKAEVYLGDQIVFVTKNEYDIFEKIVAAQGILVSRETLMKDVIGYDNYLYDRTIDTHIKNLRKKLGDPEIILTIRGKGYRLKI